MTTSIAVRRARPIGLASFADITDAALSIEPNALVFDADLTPEQVEAIWWRATSRDDADEAARRAIAAKMSAVDGAPVFAECADVRALVVALAEYILGDAP